jgi:hypothetical protein
MKVGDIVVITDGSYTRSIIDGELIHEWLNSGEAKGRRYTVIETGCSFPLVDQGRPSAQPSYRRNDTVIQDENGKVVLIHSRFLRVVESKHIWKHGDVFKNEGVDEPQIYLEPSSGPMTCLLKSPNRAGTPGIQLKGAAFLFNIKDKL